MSFFQSKYAVFAILALIVGIIIGFIIQNKIGTVHAAWYSTSWNYRQPIAITYSGTTLTNYDVVITLDTAALVSAGKMQADCDDIRLTDSDEITLISYWVESGCNTTTTQIWARVPSIPNGGKTIYVYYNNTSATNAEASWTGSFVLMGTTDCPTGWSRYAALDNRFPYGAASVGTTGGASSHTQPDISTNTSTYITAYEYQNYFNDVLYAAGHNHTATVTINSASVLPPYLNTMYCNNSDLNINANQIALFDVSAPSGWTRFTTMDNRLPQGNSSVGGTGGASTHNHTYNGGTTSLNSAPYWAVGWGYASPDASEGNHSHTWAAGNTSTDSNLPPYLTMVYASKNTTGVGTSAMITLATAIPPLGWSRFTTLDNKFPMGSASYGTSGGATTHTHSVSITTSNNDRKANPAGGPGIMLTTSPHTHTISGTSTGSSMPPYYTMIFIKRNSPVATTSTGSETNWDTPPTTPTLVLPVNNAISQSLTPIFKTVSTDGDNDYLQYELKICSDSGMTVNCQTFNQTTSNIGWSGQNVGTSAFASGTTATYVLQAGNSLAYNSTYYWKTRAVDPPIFYIWSGTQVSPFSFSTNFTPTIPSVISPVNLATTQPLTPTTFQLVSTDADNDSLQYKISLCRNVSMNLGCITFDQSQTQTGWSGQDVGTSAYSSNTTATYTYSASLEPGNTYYWRAYAIDPTGTNLWSSTQPTPQSFTVADLKTPLGCLIEESNQDTFLKLKWVDNTTTETGFVIERKVDGGIFANLTTLSAGTTNFTDSNVSSGHTYQYRIAPILPGPVYGQWCTTSTLNLQVGTIKYEKIIFH